MMAPCSFAVLCATVCASAFAAQDTPLTKVVQLLKEMHETGVKQKEEEAVKFAAFKTWCADQDRNKNAEIAAATEQIDSLNADIQKSTALIRSLSDRIQELEEDIGRWKQDMKSAGEVRKMESADYVGTHQDYQESVDAIAEAVQVLKKQAYDREQADFTQVQKSLIQLTQSRVVPKSAKSALDSFLQHTSKDYQPERPTYEAPEANAYEFQSGGVVEMLKQLKDKFGQQVYDLERDELNAKQSFEQLMQHLTDETANAQHEVDKKTTLRAETQQAKAQAEGDLAQTTADRAEDQKYLQEATGLCTNKANDFESRSKLRVEELEVIQKAIGILSGDDVSGAADRHLPSSFLQKPVPGSALAQLRSGGAQETPVLARVADFLSDRASKSNSRLLSLVSQRVTSDPFDKVKKMIQDLISKLMEEATAETEHKGWCDAELATNKVTREHKTEDVNHLTAEKEDLESSVQQLAQDIADLGASVAEMNQAMAEATKTRSDSKATNEQTIQEANDAQSAVSKAVALLKDFYAKSGEAEALLQHKQTPEEDAPETFNKPYQGLMPEGGNVVSFLEVILSDFARLETETSSAEAVEVDEHKRMMNEAEKDVALKEAERDHKTNKKSDQETMLHSTTEELKAVQEQLDKAVAYYDKLKPTCVDSGITYEERVKRREEEIQSLQEGLKILTGYE